MSEPQEYPENEEIEEEEDALTLKSNKSQKVATLYFRDNPEDIKSSVVLEKKGKKSYKGRRKTIGKSKTKKSESVAPTIDGFMVHDDDELPPECCEGFRNDARRRDGDDYMKSRMSVPWFEKININFDQQKHLCFAESLHMVDEIGRIAGKMYATVSQAKWGDENCFCTHSGSFGTLTTGIECGTTITGFVDFNMKPLQEYVYEWAVTGDKIIERKTYVMREDDTLHVRILLIKDGETVETKDTTLGRIEQQHLVTESAHIILLRLIMLEKRMFGGMDLKTLTFTGQVVKNKYVDLGSGWENIKGDQVRTWSIRRTVEFDFGDRLWDSMLNQFGRLMLRCQPENTHALIPLWFEPVKDYQDGKFVGCFPPYVWACDAELHAKYLLKKDEVAGENRTYLLEHPELRALLSDFLQGLLLRKPVNVISFAQQYFESFVKIRPVTQTTGSPVVSSSSESTVSGESDKGEWGEWAGESDDSIQYYNVKPTRSVDGLEEISDSDENYQDSNESSSDKNVIVGPDGQYVTKPK